MSMKHLFPYVKSNGIYALEDLKCKKKDAIIDGKKVRKTRRILLSFLKHGHIDSLLWNEKEKTDIDKRIYNCSFYNNEKLCIIEIK